MEVRLGRLPFEIRVSIGVRVHVAVAQVVQNSRKLIAMLELIPSTGNGFTRRRYFEEVNASRLEMAVFLRRCNNKFVYVVVHYFDYCS